MDRREFLKALGKAGVLVTAGKWFWTLSGREAVAASTGSPKLIRLAGTAHEMGRRYAEQAGDLILERLRLMRSSGSHVQGMAVAQARAFLIEHAYPVLSEIEGLAAELKEKAEDLLLLAAEPPGVGIRRGGCTSFFVDAQLTESKKAWTGQNVDDASLLERFGVVIVRHPDDSQPLITWALAGGVGAIGMNRSGICLTMNYMQTSTEPVWEAIFPEIAAHMALRKTNYAEVQSVLGSLPMTAPCAFILSDDTGQRHIVERLCLAVRGRRPPQQVAAHTNHFLGGEFAKNDIGESVFPNTRGRLERIMALLSRQGLTFEDLKKALSDTEGSPRGICREAEPRTIASILMCPADKKLYATRGRPDRAQYAEFSLTDRP